MIPPELINIQGTFVEFAETTRDVNSQITENIELLRKYYY